MVLFGVKKFLANKHQNECNLLILFMSLQVQTAIRNSYFLHASLRRNNYTPCRGFTTVSTIGPDGDISHTL